ncbi:hypothetical protein C8R45DRAFT_248795 [Mycena sanguinolenta]|nr:hypothetical protein C8R45DRAFT_248795 [Mycena sanguinolenta]
MYWNQRDNTPSTSSSSSSCSTPPTPSSDLPRSPLSKDLWTTTMQSQTTNEVLRSVLRGRKTWKTSRGGETVWPTDLEAALLEGLERYRPDDSRETRILGRFPRRNRFISDYIFDKTGTRRSPKQVGSRLQQLRESCGDTHLLDILSPFRKPAHHASSGCTDSAPSSPISSAEEVFPDASTLPHTIIYIDILPEGSPDRMCSVTRPSPWSNDGDIIHPSDHPRPLKSIKPTISFTAPSPIIANSRFTVYSEDLILHAETVPLGLVLDQPHHRSGFLYSAQLVPKYWKVILDSPDPTRFTIFQEVYKTENSAILFSAAYKFNYRHPTSHFLHPGAYDAQLHVPVENMRTYPGPVSFPGARYSMFGHSSRDHPYFDPQENFFPQKYHNQNIDSSFLHLPTELQTW